MNRGFVWALALVAGTGVVVAQTDPIATRKKTMKTTDEAAVDLIKMNKGEMAFDLAKVQIFLKLANDASKSMPTLFPETSKTGGETRAVPKIWETRADFEAKWAKLGKDTEDAMKSIKDEASFKTAFGEIDKDCLDCHRSYRARRQ